MITYHWSWAAVPLPHVCVTITTMTCLCLMQITGQMWLKFMLASMPMSLSGCAAGHIAISLCA